MIQNTVKDDTGEARELRALFEKQLKELYWTETKMATILSECMVNARSADLVSALSLHALQASHHAERLQQPFG